MTQESTGTGRAKATSSTSVTTKTSSKSTPGRKPVKKSAAQPDPSEKKATGSQRTTNTDTSDGLTIGGRTFGREMVVVALVLLGVLATPLGLASQWAFDTITDRESYVSLVSDLGRDPNIQEAVADEVTNAALERVDVSSLLEGRRDSWIGALDDLIGSVTGSDIATQLEERLRPALTTAVNGFVASDDFQSVWVSANSQAHTSLLAALQKPATADEDIAIDLSAAVNSADTGGLDGRVLSLVSKALQDNPVEIPILTAEQVDALRTGYSVIGSVSTWAPILGALALIAALVLAPSNKRWLVGCAAGFAFIASAFSPAIIELYIALAQPDVLTGDTLTAQLARHITDEAVTNASAGLGYGVPVGVAILIVTAIATAAWRVLLTRRSASVNPR